MVIGKLDSLNRRFLWGASEDKKAIHLLRWDEVCKPKRFGGLGLRKMEFHNKVLLYKRRLGDFCRRQIVFW